MPHTNIYPVDKGVEPGPLRHHISELLLPSGINQIISMFSQFILNMTEITHLEARYVDRAKLDNLLEELFRSSSNYSVKVFIL
jgi:hypothetical protein